MGSASVRKLVVTLVVSGMLLFLGACNMKVDKSADGKDKKVDIATPLGGLKVRTDNVDAKDTGLPVYPNAQLKPQNEHDEHKANVNIDTPFFGLKVVALTYTSNDTADKVLGFYRDNMKKMGSVVECKGENHGKHHTGKDDLDKPVSCEGGEVSVNGSDTHGSDTIELKTGTNGNQRIVAVKPTGSGSEFTLVYLRMHGGKEDSI